MNRLALLGIGIGTFSWISVLSVMEGLQQETRMLTLEAKPHLLWEGSPVENLAAKKVELERALKPVLRSVRFVLQSEGLIEQIAPRQKGRIRGAGVVLQGIEGLPDSEIRLGSSLEEQLLLLPGEGFRLRSAWKLDAAPLDFHDFRSFQSGLREVDKFTVQLSKRRMELWLGLESAVSRVELQLKDPFQSEVVRFDAERILGLKLKTWQESDASLWYSYKLEKFMMSLAVFFVILLGVIALHLSLSLRVAEKIREVALLRALGAESGTLARIFLTEGLVLGLAGGLMGLGGAWIFCQFLLSRLQLPAFFESVAIPVSWSWERNITCLVITLAVSLLASWKPAKRVAMVEAQEGLRS